MRVGNGIDVHRLVPGRKLVLGGVNIPFEKGLLGHSDADVLMVNKYEAISKLGFSPATSSPRHARGLSLSKAAVST